LKVGAPAIVAGKNAIGTRRVANCCCISAHSMVKCQLLAHPAVKEFIDWIETLSCGVDHLTQADYAIPK